MNIRATLEVTEDAQLKLSIIVDGQPTTVTASRAKTMSVLVDVIQLRLADGSLSASTTLEELVASSLRPAPEAHRP